MIRRRAGDEYLLITQDDHAIFSGFLAGHIGNENFAALEPNVIAAVTAHDAGWALHDDQPTLNASGQPLHVFEVPISLATRIWTASAERALVLGPYAALLVSLHQLALSNVAREHQELKGHERGIPPRELFELNKFQHQQIERQEELRKKLGLRVDLPLRLGLAAPGVDEAEDRLRFHFKMQTLCDRLSLQLCCGELLFSTIEGMYPNPTAAPVAIRTRFASEKSLMVAPWPFDAERLTAQVPCRRVQITQFPNQESFRIAYASAAVEKVEFDLAPA